MKKKVVFELSVILVTAIALVFSSFPLFKKKSLGPQSSKTPSLTKPVTSASVIKIKPMKDDTFFVRLNNAADALPLERDPFLFAGIGVEGSRDSLDLTGILSDQGKLVAVINGQFLSAGGTVNQCQVVSVQGAGVTMRDSQGTFELFLKQG